MSNKRNYIVPESVLKVFISDTQKSLNAAATWSIERDDHVTKYEIKRKLLKSMAESFDAKFVFHDERRAV